MNNNKELYMQAEQTGLNADTEQWAQDIIDQIEEAEKQGEGDAN